MEVPAERLLWLSQPWWLPADPVRHHPARHAGWPARQPGGAWPNGRSRLRGEASSSVESAAWRSRSSQSALLGLAAALTCATVALRPRGAGPGPRRPPRIPECVSITFLGDSLTAGYGVDGDQAFPAIIERTLRAEGLQGRRGERRHQRRHHRRRPRPDGLAAAPPARRAGGLARRQRRPARPADRQLGTEPAGHPPARARRPAPGCCCWA